MTPSQSDINSKLLASIQDGDLTKLRSLIKKMSRSSSFPKNLNSSDSMGEGVLHYAARYNRLDTAKILLEAGANVNHRDKFKMTPLIMALKSNTAIKQRKTPDSNSIVKLLIDWGSDVNAQAKDFSTALHWAALYDDAQPTIWLIEAGAELNPKPKLTSETPLHWASHAGLLGPVEALLSAGANPYNTPKGSHKTPLHEAARMGHIEVVRLFLHFGMELTDTIIRNAHESIIQEITAIFEQQKLMNTNHEFFKSESRIETCFGL